MTIRKITHFAGHVLVLALVSGLVFSQTATAAPCSAELDALKTALEGGICTKLKSEKSKSKKSKSRKCKGLDRKLDNADRKLEKGKFRHAARKLTDFGRVVEDMALRRKPKISMEDYQALMNPYYVAAADCIASGGVSTLPADDDGGDTSGGDVPAGPITVPF